MRTTTMKPLFWLAALVAAGSIAQAQVAGLADPTSLDTLSGADTGGGGAGALGLERARGVVNSANANDPFGDPQDPAITGAAADPFGGPAVGAPAGGPGGIALPSLAALKPPTLTAWGGERITCKRTGAILQDAREVQILATMSGTYYDDGQQGGDAKAGDNIYTNITEVKDAFLSPESHLVKTRMVLILQYLSRLSPMEFSQVRVATTEPLSPLPKLVSLEEEQDKKLEDWVNTFLADFRLDPNRPDSGFVPTFLPPPPRAPNIPLPVTFTMKPLPAAPGGAAGEGGGVGGAAASGGKGGASTGGGTDVRDGVVSGEEPIGNASSRYF